MSICRHASASALLALFGLLAASSGPVRAQKEKEKDKDKLDPDTAALLKLVEEAVKAKDYRNDPKHGNGSSPYEDSPSKPGIVVGMDIWPGVKDKTTQYVRGVRPLFLNNEGKKTQGQIHGWVSTGAVRVDAKPGYALGAMKVHTDFDEIAGLQLVFYKITATGLDKSDSYDSKYFGHKDPDTARLVGGTGEPILGIHGLVADSAKSHNFGLGLIIMGEKKKKK